MTTERNENDLGNYEAGMFECPGFILLQKYKLTTKQCYVTLEIPGGMIDGR
jgi:hypothetical protein